MVRSYVADAKVQEILNDLSSSGDGSVPLVGLIIGQFSDQRDYILHLMRTPILDGKTRDTSAADGDTEVVPSKKHLLPGKSSSPEMVLEKSICVHARQVRQMLTGGLNVMGMFVHCTSDNFKTSHSKYKQLLQCLSKVIGKFDFLLPNEKSKEMVFLHVCSDTKRLSCRSLDISDNKHSFAPTEMKFQKLLESFVGLKTEFSLQTSIYVEEKDMSHCLERQIINGLNPIIKSIWESVPVVNGNMLDTGDDDDDDSLSRKSMDFFKKNIKGKKPGKKHSHDDDGDFDGDDDDDDYIQVDLLRSYSNYSNKSSTVSVPTVRCGAKVVANGTISCRAFVHGRSTLSEGVEALKLDVIRSLLTRCELVCQDLLQGEEDQDVRAVYETPVRAFASLHGSPVRLSDYLFQDETPSDSLGRFKEVLDMVDLNEVDVDQSQESIPVAEDFDQAESILKAKDALFAGLRNAAENSVPDGNSWVDFLKPFISIPFSVLVASVASLTASYWYLGQNFREASDDRS